MANLSDDPGQGPIPEHLLPAKKACDDRRRWGEQRLRAEKQFRMKRKYDWQHPSGGGEG